MASRKDWIPTRTEEFKVFADNFCTLVALHATDWNVSDAYKSKLTALKAGYDAAQAAADAPATRTSITIAAAKMAREADGQLSPTGKRPHTREGTKKAPAYRGRGQLEEFAV